MKRRDFMKTASPVCGAGLLQGFGSQRLQANTAQSGSGPQPNMLSFLSMNYGSLPYFPRE